MSTPASPEQVYFRQIEDTFIRLRGSPFLLSPSDWRLALGWYEAGIPVEVVCRGLEELFARRAERGDSGKVQSLRYCAAAVESAWRERRELGSAHVADPGYAVDVEERLARLAAALPAALPGREAWVETIRGAKADAQSTEQRLAELDHQLVAEAVARLSRDARRDLEAAVEASLSEVRERMTSEALAADRERLLRERARREARLPLLSLFSPDAR